MDKDGSVLVTGATGFIGHVLVDRLLADAKCHVRASVRREIERYRKDMEMIQVSEISQDTDWQLALSDIEIVVHTAARAHILRKITVDQLSEMRRINVDGTLNLARQAAAAGVKRFIFISSIKVNGEQTAYGKKFSESDVSAPKDCYGMAKWEAEQGLLEIANETKMEVVIIRPPLVYGPGVKANFLRMMQWLKKGLPLPFGAINNRRSLIGVDNLVDLIVTCIDHPAAANQVFLVSDNEVLSTTELLRRTAHALHVPARLYSFPVRLLGLMATIIGKRSLAQRLVGSLEVDISKAKERLGWSPPWSFEEELSKTARAFLQERLD